MIELDAAQALTFPQVFKAREVVRRGFLSNLLFANVSGIFRAVEHFQDILNQLPVAKEKKVERGKPVEVPVPPPTTDADGNAQVDVGSVINPKVAELGKPVYSDEDVPPLDPATTKTAEAAKKIAASVTEKARETRAKAAAEYGMTAKQVENDEKATEAQVKAKVERAFVDHQIVLSHIDAAAKDAATEFEFQAVEVRTAEAKAELDAQVLSIFHDTLDKVTETLVKREETKKAQQQVDKTMDAARDHLRGFARTIPMFVMAYGDRNITLANFDDYTDDDVFAEVTGITEEDFRKLRDGRDVVDSKTGEVLVSRAFLTRRSSTSPSKSSSIRRRDSRVTSTRR